MAVANRGEDIMSDEICRPFNGKQQCRRRSGRSVCSSETGLGFGTLLRDMYACIRTYGVRRNISGENKKHPPEVRSRDGHTCRTCVQKFRSISCKTSWTYRLLCGKHANLGSCLYLLGSSVASGFCVMFHLKFTYYYREVKFCVKPFTDGHAVK